MYKKTITPVELDRLKREAKAVKKVHGISHSSALEWQARRYGFRSYWAVTRSVSEAKPQWGDLISVHFALDRKRTYDCDRAELELLGIVEDDEFRRYLGDTTTEEYYEDGLQWWQVFRIKRVRHDDVAAIVHKVMDHFFFPPEEVWVGGRVVPLDGLRTERVDFGVDVTSSDEDSDES